MSPKHQQDRADVELRLPADGAYVSLVRTTTAGLAARLHFTMDEVEDLRIAVGEACAMVLPEALDDSELVCSFWLVPGALTLSVSVRTDGVTAPDLDGFTWQVLDTLATEAAALAEAGRFTVRMTMHSMLATSDS